MANSHGAQVPEVDAQTQLFGVSSGPPSPIARMMYNNGTLSRNRDSLLELDKALNYEVRVVTGNSNQPYVVSLDVSFGDFSLFSNPAASVSFLCH